MPGVTRTLVLLACLTLGACGGGGQNNDGEGDKTYEGDGFSFKYPGGWDEGEAGEAAAQEGEPVSEATFGPSEGSNALSVQVYRLPVPITEGNIDEASVEIADLVRELFRQADGRVTSGPTRVTVGGLLGLRFEGSLVNSRDVPVQAWLTLAFDGRTEYLLDCEFTPEGAEEMKSGCDQVEESFQVE